MALPKGEVTLKHMVTGLYSRPDNVWGSAEILRAVTRCEVDASYHPPCTDHFPIVMILDLEQDRATPLLTCNFRMVDWDAFNQKLIANLKTIPPPAVLNTGDDIQLAASKLTRCSREL